MQYTDAELYAKFGNMVFGHELILQYFNEWVRNDITNHSHHYEFIDIEDDIYKLFLLLTSII
jgi:hypothetical protein